MAGGGSTWTNEELARVGEAEQATSRIEVQGDRYPAELQSRVGP
jgi:hypothetical protein